MGYYPATSAHPPFVHVDVRGTAARWKGLMKCLKSAVTILCCGRRPRRLRRARRARIRCCRTRRTSTRCGTRGSGRCSRGAFPRATPEELLKARAYAYGGSVIQDLGYFPFGSRFFSNLLHYVRTGDFVEAMIRDAKDLPEYAFALGALAHYAADNVGHPEAVNRSVALMYPKLRAQYGDSVTYADSPATHVLVEFSFDVVQVATGAYKSEAYQRFIGFEVAKPVLERAFHATYGLEMKDVFLDEDLVDRLVPLRDQPADSRRSRASPGATSSDEIMSALPGHRAGAVRLQPLPAGVRARLRHASTASPACSRGSGVPVQAAAEGRAAPRAAVQGADAGGRGAVSGEPQRHARPVPRRARRRSAPDGSIWPTPTSTPASRARTASTRWPTIPTPSCSTGSRTASLPASPTPCDATSPRSTRRRRTGRRAGKSGSAPRRSAKHLARARDGQRWTRERSAGRRR